MSGRPILRDDFGVANSGLAATEAVVLKQNDLKRHQLLHLPRHWVVVRSMLFT